MGEVTGPGRGLGELATDHGLVSRGALREALAIQTELEEAGFRVSLGRILVEKRYLSRPALAALADIEARQPGSPDRPRGATLGIVRLSPPEREVLSERARREGTLSAEDLLRCRRVAAVLERHGIERDWTELAIEMGLLPRERARELARGGPSGSEREEPPSPDSGILLAIEEGLGPEKMKKLKKYGLGHLAIRAKLASSDQVKDALCVQLLVRELGIFRRIGEVLVARGVFGQKDLEKLLAVQKKKLSGLEWLAELAPPAEPGFTTESLMPPPSLANSMSSAEDEADQVFLRLAEDSDRDAPDLAQEIFHNDESGLFKAVEERLGNDLLARIRRFRFGNLAIEKGLTTRERVRHALLVQMRLAGVGVVKKLGEILVEEGALGPVGRDRLLETQRQHLSRVPWSELVPEEEGLDDRDRALSRLLVENSIVGADEVRECCYVERVLSELGIRASLADVLVEKGVMDREVVESLVRSTTEEAASASQEAGVPAPGQVAKSALRKAYDEILAHERYKAMETGVFSRPELRELLGVAGREKALTSARPHSRPSRRMAWAAGALSLTLLLAAAVYGFPALLASRESPPPPPAPSRVPVVHQAEPTGTTFVAEGEIVGEVFENPAGAEPGRVRFDFLLKAGDRFHVVRGESLAREGALSGLEDRRQIEVRGRFATENRLPAVRLPDGTWTRGYIDLESFSLLPRAP
ncbi:MAG: hypothetical protein HY720_04045 [Planctomycetes bacterium]|nr:hypothetical protein [Planctomycetota bacterium]